MAASVSISVLGTTNSGKSSFINAFLKERVLPQGATSETSVMTHVKLVRTEEPVLNTGSKPVKGQQDVYKELKRLNHEMRHRELSLQEVIDVALFCAPCESLARLGDGTINVIDIPGYDEVANPVVKDTFKWAIQLSDVVMVNVAHEAVGSDSLKGLLQMLEEDAPHLLLPRVIKGVQVPNDARLVFVITKCDVPAERAMVDNFSDEPDDALSQAAIAKLRTTLKALLDEHWGERFPHAARAPVFAISAENVAATKRGRARDLFDWPALEQFLADTHAQAAILRNDRKLKQAKRVIDLVHGRMAVDRYPNRAAQVIAKFSRDVAAQRDADKQAQRTKTLLYSVGVIVGAGVCIGGGWAVASAYGAYTAATASAAAATQAAGAAWFSSTAAAASAAAATASSAAATAVSQAITYSAISVGGVTLVLGSSAGVKGAVMANDSVVFDATYESITKLEPYEDTLAVDADTVYVGHFKGKKPHGPGRAFYQNEKLSESIIGEFKDGRFLSGTILDEKACVIGVFRQDENEGLILDGWQPDGESGDDFYCIVCFEKCAMFTLQQCFKECRHGTCCAECADIILRSGEQATCPMCRKFVTAIVKFT